MNNKINHEINIEDIKNILAYIQKISPHRELHTLFKSTINHTYGVGLPGENVEQKTKEIGFHYVITRGQIYVLINPDDQEYMISTKDGRVRCILVYSPYYSYDEDDEDIDSPYKRIHTYICDKHHNVEEIKERGIHFIYSHKRIDNIPDLAWIVLEEYINTPFKNKELDPYLNKLVMILLKHKLTYTLETLNALSPSSENGVNAFHNDTIPIKAILHLYDDKGETYLKKEEHDFNFNYVITKNGIYLIHLTRTFDNKFTILDQIKNYICDKHHEIKNIRDKRVYRSFNLDEMEGQLRDEITELEERKMEEQMMEEQTKEYDKLNDLDKSNHPVAIDEQFTPF